MGQTGEGDLWNFASVIPHSIQGLDEGCEFLLVFDNGSFSENETFLLTDLFNHIPRDARCTGTKRRSGRTCLPDAPASRQLTSKAAPSSTMSRRHVYKPEYPVEAAATKAA